MRKAYTYFSIQDSKLCLLVKREELFSLPSLLDVDSTPLSKRRSVQGYFSFSSAPKEYKDYEWRDILTITKFSHEDGAIVCEGLGELFPLLNEIKSPLPKLFIKNKFNNNEATFFGGSFNPWHEGHSECLKRCPADNIIIIPDRNPWKEELEIECFFESFMELAKKFKNTPYSIFPGFYGLEEPNPTISWLPKSLFKNKSLLIGDDNFCSFFKWRGAEELLSNLNTIYVLNRNHTLEEIELAKNNTLEMSKSINVSILGEHEFMSLSSTELRAKN